MITGLMEPSAGEGFVCGHSVTHDSASIQAIIGGVQRIVQRCVRCSLHIR